GDVSPGALLAVETGDRDVGRAEEPVRVCFGRERQGPRVRRGVETELLDPRELAASDDLARDRIEPADVLVAQPQHPRRTVDGALDDLGPAQVGEIELR